MELTMIHGLLFDDGSKEIRIGVVTTMFGGGLNVFVSLQNQENHRGEESF